MPIINAHDTRLYYEVQGAGPPLILLSGFTQVCQVWHPYLPLLTPHFQVYLVDNRGAGQSDAPESGYSIECFAEDIIGFLDALALPSAYFMGQSMGALIIQQLCITHYDRVNRAVLCSPFAKLPPVSAHHLRCLLKLLQYGVPKELLIEENLAWLLSNHFIKNPQNVHCFIKELQQNPYQQSMEGLMGQATALLQADLREHLNEIPHEILLLAGEEDILIPLKCVKELKDRIPNSHLHVLPKSAHLFPYEIPEQVAKMALKFLRS